MKYLLYDIAIHATALAAAPYYAYKALTTGKYASGLAERFGRIDAAKLAPLGGGPVLWVHAVSVGETRAVLPVIKLFKERNPGARVVLSTVTKTGNEVAERDGARVADAVIYFPLDLSWVVSRVIRRVAPALVVVVEKEFWPNFYHRCELSGIPIVVVNGTISDRSHRRFVKYKRLFSGVFSAISVFAARTEGDRVRAIDAGVPPERAVTTGNIKFDLSPPESDPARLAALRDALGVSEGQAVVVAGSTHEGEEEIVLDAFKGLVSEFPGIKLVLAPRHPERFDAVEGILRSSGLTYARRTGGGGDAAREASVVMLDTVGELMAAYSFATVAVVAGSLVPGIGGHNLLEPAYYGKPVIYGSHLTSYLGMAEILEDAGAGARAADARSLRAAISGLLKDPARRKSAGEAARSVVEANRGAARKTVEILERFLSVSA